MKTFPVTMFRNYFVSILATRAPLRRVAVLTPEFWRPTTNTRASASPARLRPVNAPDEAATMSAGGGRHGRSCETNLVSLGAGFSWEMPPGELASVAWLRARLRRELGRARLVVGSY